MSTTILSPAAAPKPRVAAAIAHPLRQPGPKQVPAISVVRGFHLAELDGLRGIAAVGAVVFHYLLGPGMLSPAIEMLRTALDCSPVSLDTFFVLSGFLIGGILLRAKESPNYYRTFYARRAYRILPLYYTWVVICLLFFYFAPGWGSQPVEGYRFSFVAASFFLFFHNFFPVIVKGSLIASPTWTLAVEEHFYLAAPALVRKLSERHLIHVLVGVIVTAPLLRGVLYKYVGHGSDWSVSATYLWTFCRADALALGVLLAVLWSLPERRARIKAWSRLLVPALLTLTGLVWLGQILTDRHVPHTYTITAAFGRTATELSCAALLVLVLSRPEAMFSRFLRTPFMREMGKISYCLYLAHWGVLWILTRFLFHTQFGRSLPMDLLLAAVAFAASIGLAKLSLRYIEEPLMRRGHRYSY